MTENHLHAWSIRSVVVSVSDLDHSSNFYQEVTNTREVLRESRVAVLSNDPPPSFTVYLREAPRNAVRSGQQGLGVRVFSFDVGSIAELDRVEGRLRDLAAFQDRRFLDEAESFEMVYGHDPDRLPLGFVAHKGELSGDDYRRALARMYSIDL